MKGVLREREVSPCGAPWSHRRTTVGGCDGCRSTGNAKTDSFGAQKLAPAARPSPKGLFFVPETSLHVSPYVRHLFGESDPS